MTRDLRRDVRPGLYCVELRSEDWAKLVDWYRNVLGLRVLVRVVDDGYALLEAGDTRIALLSRESAGTSTRRISLAFEVEDVPRICARLEVYGSVMEYAESDPEGFREVNTYDPDGNRIRLFSWPNR